MKRRSIKLERKLPIWLRRLRWVKKELEGTRWPRGQEGFQQALYLTAWGLQTLSGKEKEKSLLQFAQSDRRWSLRWKKERARIFPPFD